METRESSRFEFLKSTAIGGLIFLLPLIVVSVLLGHLAGIVMPATKFLHDTLGINTAYGYAFLFLVAIVLLVVLCFVAGLVARWTIGKRLGEWFERHVTLIFPRYTIYKDQVAGGAGGTFAAGRMKPVLLVMPHMTRLGFEIERSEAGVVTIYLPGAPDPWSGEVGFVTADRVTPIEADFGDVMKCFESLGRGATEYVKTLPSGTVVAKVEAEA